MSTIELQATVRSSHEFRSGEAFQPAQISSRLTRAGRPVSTQRACEVLREMIANGEVVRVGRKYQRARSTANWLQLPWRRLSDEQIGLTKLDRAAL